MIHDRVKIEALIEAMEQLLADMGKDGQCVCLFAKAKARIVIDPFLTEDATEGFMPLDAAQEIVNEGTAMMRGESYERGTSSKEL